MKPYSIALIPGDGIGPEITTAVVRVLEAAGANLQWIPCKAGVAALESGGDVLPEATTEAIRHYGVALKGPCTTPVGKGFSSVNVQLRKQLNLYAAVRPVRSLPGVATRFENVDLVIIAAEPRLAPHIDSMRSRLAEILQIAPESVGLKATTTDGMGFTGRGEGIAVQAIATLDTGVAEEP